MIPKPAATPIRLGLAACLLAVVASAARAGEQESKRRLKSDLTQEYWVYLPSDFDAARTYWLLVAVHGLGGKGEGALGWAKFADEGQCIVVGPTFKGTYQFPTAKNEPGRNMVAIFKELGQQYKLQRKLFITGFSAGAQFAHRFTLECPQHVVACAAHSAGSWGSPNAKAKYVPFAVTCGEADRSRIDIARNFAADLERKGYKVTTAWYKDVGHSMCAEARELTRELYWSVTTGMTVEQREKAVAAVEAGETLLEEGKFAEAYTALIALARAKRKSALSERAAAILRQIATLGGERLQAIEQQAKTDRDGAIAALGTLAAAFKGFRVARTAALRLRELQGAQASATPPDPKPTTAAEPTAKPGPKPPPKTAGSAARWLSLARNFMANDRNDAARRYLNMILARCPDSDEADEARVLLMELDAG